MAVGRLIAIADKEARSHGDTPREAKLALPSTTFPLFSVGISRAVDGSTDVEMTRGLIRDTGRICGRGSSDRDRSVSGDSRRLFRVRVVGASIYDLPESESASESLLEASLTEDEMVDKGEDSFTGLVSGSGIDVAFDFFDW